MIDDTDHLLDRPLNPDDFERRMVIRNRGVLFPENGKIRTLSLPTPPYGDGLITSEPDIVRTEGGVIAFDLLLDNPIGSSSTDVTAFRVGDFAGTFTQIYFDPSEEIIIITLQQTTPTRQAFLSVPYARCLLSNTRATRLAVGIRLHDPHRLLCLWADGRLVGVAGKGTFPTQPTTWASSDETEIENNSGIRIVSPQVAYYRGAPEPRGANR